MYEPNHCLDLADFTLIGLLTFLTQQTLCCLSVNTYSEWPVFYVLLDGFVVPVTSDHSFDIKHGVLWIRSQLILSRVSDKTLVVSGESHIGWGDSVSLVVGDDLDTSIFKYTNTRNRSSSQNRTCATCYLIIYEGNTNTNRDS